MASESRISNMQRDGTMKKRRRSSPTSLPYPVSNLFILILLMAFSETCVRFEHHVDGFVGSQSLYYNTGGSIIYRPQCTQLAADPNKYGEDAERSGSRFKVRKRVKAVLEKARIRTGVKNGSVPPPQRSASTVVAEAAALGGLGDDEELGLLKTNGVTKNEQQNEIVTNGKSLQTSSNSVSRKPKDFDVIRGDVPSAADFCEPLPFELPKLTVEQKIKLVNGKRIQEQSRMGREGSGYVVLDIEAAPYVIWECLLDFESYPELIPTVRAMQLYTSTKLNTGFVNEKPVLPGTGRETRHYGTPSITRASFILSKFRLNIAAIHKYTPHPNGDYMEFTLDPSCTNVVLKGAKGTWYTEENPDGRKGFTRVYLLASLQISRALPKFIVDYAAERAMPRATNWLKPEVEALKEFWLTDDDGQ
ncbi:hypothetical protein FRACYDRAFT_249280 [Fragilariopsis cylindrus CCMP1102]|uniref:Coenzyme Q-binding protein COQ10 START domain-containing protein n=1 Tax=Fragilariopsis cylindrus CCMP1102 TaxID=635003 RepID=A0A1E7ESF0_9STRA|nr:hypothetical protein FRACYDRAFT_249280 [Fragilariopsis cylindrus CCMP1102]|eukprot:OEU08938.1 hypothetical protein FRACYDRAFT_249280 [Fragilariopsis cylindrus CCMP1102]